nr:SMC-Scp complex subunit ScpB [Planosporangium mesophilum]
MAEESESEPVVLAEAAPEVAAPAEAPVAAPAPRQPAEPMEAPEPEPESLTPEPEPEPVEESESELVDAPEPPPAPDPAILDDPTELRGAVESILLVIDEPVSEITLAQVLDQPTDRILAVLVDLVGDYTAQRRGFELRRAAGGWRLYTRADYAAYVERFVLDGQQVRLTQAALETLAVIAYKQPVTRSRISAIRGVNCDGVVRTLLSRGLIEDCGSEPDSGAFLYRTTPLFLEKLGINSVEDLPPLAPFLPDDVDEIANAQG